MLYIQPQQYTLMQNTLNINLGHLRRMTTSREFKIWVLEYEIKATIITQVTRTWCIPFSGMQTVKMLTGLAILQVGLV